MRIAYVINSLEGGGAALPIPRIIGVMREAGAEVAVFALQRRDGRALPSIEGARIPVRVRDGTGGHLPALRWLDMAIAAYRPSHIWTSLTRATALGQLVGLRRAIPVASWQHAGWLKPANLRLLRATRRLSTLWVADSESVAAFVARRLGVPDTRLATWPIFAADPARPQARAWRPGEALRIGSLGRLHDVKGYDVLIDAMRIVQDEGRGLPPFALSIAGEGGARATLAALAAERGVALSLPGFAGDPAAYLAGIHLYVQPSRSEGFCVAAHEAMDAGLPVIGSAVGEMARSIAPGCSGSLVPPGDPRRLAQALLAALEAPQGLAEIGRRARARIGDRFSPDRFRAAGEAALRRLADLSSARC